MTNILITGASGYLGTELTQQFLKEDSFQLLLLSSKKEELLETYKKNKRITIYTFDELNSKIDKCKIDVVVNFAFARAHKESLEIAKSLVFTKQLLELIENCSAQYFINLSSQEVYGKAEVPWKETTFPDPNTIYGFAKLNSELLTSDILKDTNYINLRLAGVVSYTTHDRMINKISKFAKENHKINLVGGDQVFTQIHTKDVINCISEIIQKREDLSWNEVYNLGYPKSYSILQIANEIKSQIEIITNKKIEINLDQKITGINADLNSNYLINNLNWQPKFDLKKMVESIIIKLKKEINDN